MSQQHEVPVTITTARSGRSADIHRREVKYLISMAIRTVCFILAVVLSGWLRWVMVGGAFFLPYFAVIIANAADGRESAGPAQFDSENLTQIRSSTTPLDPHSDDIT